LTAGKRVLGPDIEDWKKGKTLRPGEGKLTPPGCQRYGRPEKKGTGLKKSRNKRKEDSGSKKGEGRGREGSAKKQKFGAGAREDERGIKKRQPRINPTSSQKKKAKSPDLF